MFGDGVRIMKHGVQHEINKAKERDDKSKDRERENAALRRSSICKFISNHFSIFHFGK